MPTYPHCSLKDFRQEVNWEDRLASLTDSSLGNTSRVPPECNEGSKQDTARQVPSQKKSPCLLGIPYNRAFWLFAFCSGLCKGKWGVCVVWGASVPRYLPSWGLPFISTEGEMRRLRRGGMTWLPNASLSCHQHGETPTNQPSHLGVTQSSCLAVSPVDVAFFYPHYTISSHQPWGMRPGISGITTITVKDPCRLKRASPSPTAPLHHVRAIWQDKEGRLPGS